VLGRAGIERFLKGLPRGCIAPDVERLQPRPALVITAQKIAGHAYALLRNTLRRHCENCQKSAKNTSKRCHFRQKHALSHRSDFRLDPSDRALLDDEHARYAVGSVAVPYGTCTEPSNVAAGGGACPVRFRCAGCDHFRTDVSYLPDLTAHLDDLLRTRERLAAMTGVDDWARAAAAPPQQEITRIRQLISRIQGDIATLSDQERAVIDAAVATIREHRAVHVGMPAIGSRTTSQEETA